MSAELEWDYGRAFLKVPNGIVRALAKHPIALAVYMQILLRARWTDGEVMTSHGRRWLRAGQAVFGRGELAEALGASESTIRTSIKRLQNVRILTIESTKLGSVATLHGYGGISGSEGPDQPSDRPTIQPTDRPRSDQENAHDLASNLEGLKAPHAQEGKEERESAPPPPASLLSEIRNHYESGWREAWNTDPSEPVEWTEKRHQKPLVKLLKRRSPEDVKRAITRMFHDPPKFPTGKDIDTLERFFDAFHAPRQEFRKSECLSDEPDLSGSLLTLIEQADKARKPKFPIIPSPIPSRVPELEKARAERVLEAQAERIRMLEAQENQDADEAKPPWLFTIE